LKSPSSRFKPWLHFWCAAKTVGISGPVDADVNGSPGVSWNSMAYQSAYYFTLGQKFIDQMAADETSGTCHQTNHAAAS
jgi:hypothetical protein